MASNKIVNAIQQGQKRSIPVRIKRSSEGDPQIQPLSHFAKGIPKAAASPNPSGEEIEPQARIIQRPDGECDIVFTCSCGKETTIRCHTLKASPSPPPASPAPPPVNPPEVS